MPSSLAKWMEPEQAHAGEVRKLSTLLEASQALSSTLDLKQGLHRVLEILGRHHGALRSTVVLLNEDTGEVEVEASAGAVTPGKRVRYRLGEGITGQVVQSGKPIVVPRVSREPAFLNRAAERPELPQQELTYISAPISLEGQDRRRRRRRPALQGGPRLPPHGQVSRRRRIDDRAGGQGASADPAPTGSGWSTRTRTCARS